MSKAFEIIEASIIEAKKKNIRIIGGGAMYEKSGSNIVGVNAFGAVALNCNMIPEFYSGWLKDLCNILEENTYWYWRFLMGFDYNHQLYIVQPGKLYFLESEEEKDTVSEQAIRLRKKYRG